MLELIFTAFVGMSFNSLEETNLYVVSDTSNSSYEIVMGDEFGKLATMYNITRNLRAGISITHRSNRYELLFSDGQTSNIGKSDLSLGVNATYIYDSFYINYNYTEFSYDYESSKRIGVGGDEYVLETQSRHVDDYASVVTMGVHYSF